MKKQTIITGYLLIIAALCFWGSWYLMPDPGTTDAGHILTIVKQSRINVLCSVVLQIISAVLYLVALFLFVRIADLKNIAFSGIALMAIGAMGLCADAFFHLLAWSMTDDAVSIQGDVVRVMTFMQTKGLIFLVPLLLPFFIGSLVLAIGLNKQAIVSRLPVVVVAMAFVVGIPCIIAAKAPGFRGPWGALTMLGLFAVGQILIGVHLIKRARRSVDAEAFSARFSWQ